MSEQSTNQPPDQGPREQGRQEEGPREQPPEQGRPTVLVTGATGTVGRLVVDGLLAAGAEVRALSRAPERAALPAGVRVLRGDLTDPASLRAALGGADAVFLLWPFAGAEGARAVLEETARHARRVVYLSSAAVREHEREVERLVERSGIGWTVLRPHALAANARRWADGVRTGGVVREAFGAATTAPVDERDVAAVAVRALTGDGQLGAVLELTGPRSMTRSEQAGILGEALGRPVRWEEAGEPEARQQMLDRGWPAAAADGVLRDLAASLAAPAVITDTVREVTGAPALSFHDWARAHAGEFRPTMRAARIHGFGGPEVIRIDTVPRPVPGAGEVLIRVAATSFNPTEAALRAGLLRDLLPVALPYTLGWDVAGTVVGTGPGVTGLAPGDRVIGRVDAGGGGAEYALAPAALLAAAPRTVPLADAAAIPLAGLTAWQAVFEGARLGAGQRVLVNGAGGGVGVFAVQLAKHAGAEVVAVAGPHSAAAVARLGADQVVDRTAGPLAGAVGRPVDVVLNLAPVAPEAAAALVPLVRPGGLLVSVATEVPVPPGVDATAVHLVARNDARQLARLVRLVDSGALTVPVAASYPLDELARVHRDSEAGPARGKITLVP
ncbi:NAD(P)H-binding protein [Kitasatospora indigofera]|uniref:NAD(P)H-binding protein n=1 Tax=Kitasatospora indigofera TaxID=67307 RepID=UPI003631E962